MTIHKKRQKLNFIDVILHLDATSLYPSALWDEKPVYPKTEIRFAFKPHMINVFVEVFIFQSFNQDGNESATLKLKNFNPPNLIVQHFSVEGKVKNIEVNRMRNGYIIDTLTSVEICEIVKMGGEVVEIYEGVIEKTFKNHF